MSNIVPIDPRPLAQILDLDPFNPESSRGDLAVGGGDQFANLSIRGGRFHIRSTGNDEPIVDAAGVPVSSYDVVILKARPNRSRAYYEGDYEEGEGGVPMCQSLDGIAPGGRFETAQAPTCAACPYSVWGSATSTASGKAITACREHQRLAVVPAPACDPATLAATGPPDIILNAAHDGAMLLRVPGTSSKALAHYGAKLDTRTVAVAAVVTRLSFEPSAAYPSLLFNPVRALNADERARVLRVWPTMPAVLGLELPPAAVIPEPPVDTPTPPAPDAVPDAPVQPDAPAQPTPAPAASAVEPEPVKRKRRTSAEVAAEKAAKAAAREDAAAVAAKKAADAAEAALSPGSDGAKSPNLASMDSELDSIMTTLRGQ